MRTTLVAILLLLLTTFNAGRADSRSIPAMFRVIATVMTSSTGGQKLANGERNDANKRAFVALPSRSALDRKVVVYCPETGTTIHNIPVDDVGPHSTKDAYWEHKGHKPLAELGKSDKYVRATNKAGIDLSLKLCRNLGLVYPFKGIVEWQFEDEKEL